MNTSISVFICFLFTFKCHNANVSKRLLDIILLFFVAGSCCCCCYIDAPSSNFSCSIFGKGHFNCCTLACAITTTYRTLIYYMIRYIYVSICLINRFSFTHLLCVWATRWSHSFLFVHKSKWYYIRKMHWRVVKLFHQIIVIVPCLPITVCNEYAQRKRRETFER